MTVTEHNKTGKTKGFENVNPPVLVARHPNMYI